MAKEGIPNTVFINKLAEPATNEQGEATRHTRLAWKECTEKTGQEPRLPFARLLMRQKITENLGSYPLVNNIMKVEFIEYNIPCYIYDREKAYFGRGECIPAFHRKVLQIESHATADIKSGTRITSVKEYKSIFPAVMTPERDK